MRILSTSPSVVPTKVPQRQASWQASMKSAVRDIKTLCKLVSLPERVSAEVAATDFPVFAPLEYIAKMKQGDLHDPLLQQVLPTSRELENPPGYVSDPVQDSAALVSPGLLKKYAGRALLVTTGACAVHCRYCFRRHFPYSENALSAPHWEQALEAIRADNSLREVLLSGGDPLTLSDDRLHLLVQQLEAIPHLRRLRIHTRLPLMIPRRVTDHMLHWLTASRLSPIFVIHANHANELVDDAARAITQLQQAGIPLLNQSVLMRGVNDDIVALTELSNRLCDLGVIPYYLHQLDRVRGAHHFEVSIRRGRELVLEMRRRLPGYAVPRYVEEVAGESSKTVLA